MSDFFDELKKRHVFRVAFAYSVAAWVVAQIAGFAFDTFGFPDRVLQYLVLVLLLGLPIAVILAWAYEFTPLGVKRSLVLEKDESVGGPTGRWQRRLVMLTTLTLLAALISFGVYHRSQSTLEMQRAMARLSQALELTAEDRFGEAYAAIQGAVSVLDDSPDVRQLLDDIALEINPRTMDEDAKVSFRPYDVPEAPWTLVTDSARAPALAPKGALLLRVEKPGYDTREFAVANPGPMLQNVGETLMEEIISLFPIPHLELYESGVVSPGMVRVPATNFPIFLSGFADGTLGSQRYEIPAFDIAGSEVTNREFKAFVDEGGYSNPAYWSGLRLIDGSPVNDTIIETFLDLTGRPGPSNWELGNYPTGAANQPVGGISLYEAKAYARYRGMLLPTIHHWSRAAFAPMEGMGQVAPFVAHDSNFGAEVVPADEIRGIGPWGTVQMAGNAREWVWNTSNELGLALGGAWTNYDDVFQQAYTISPLDRAPENGMRLMHALGEPVDPQLLEPINLNEDALSARHTPIDNDAFETLRYQFSHVPRTPLSITNETVESNDSWKIEELSLEFPGSGELTMFIITPVNPSDKLQAVIYMPHSGALRSIPNRDLLEQLGFMDYVVRAGRAIVIPVMDGMAQRFSELPSDQSARADAVRRRTLARYEDVASTIDYLESRGDIDSDKIGFLGFSYGAYESATFLAIEDRIKALVLISGGTPYWDYSDPMADPINYYPRVMQPALLINGRYDHLFTYENSQLYMLELLGAAEEHKRHLVFEEGHFDFPRNTVSREVSDWLDTYLGPVR
ncbi:MAG: SUMF1/EgtB/PvdO family nonheme iron enzyme [Congregibacter sp.]